jgi:hypothetical protein
MTFTTEHKTKQEVNYATIEYASRVATNAANTGGCCSRVDSQLHRFGATRLQVCLGANQFQLQFVGLVDLGGKLTAQF